MFFSYLLSSIIAIMAIIILFINLPTLNSSPEANVFEFGLVADLDKDSRNPEKFEWISYLKKGLLITHNDLGKITYSVNWTEKLTLRSNIATYNRSMELSDIKWWNGKYLCVCDFTGIVYKIRPRLGEVFPRFVLADGDGKTLKTSKAEWMATKDNQLFIGSHGKEWVRDGVIMSRGSEWVKVINSNGQIRNLNWGTTFQAIRKVTNTSFPGYLTHEAVLYNRRIEKWVFLPRKASQNIPYDEISDEEMGANLLILIDKNLEEGSIQVKRIGPLEKTFGFSSVAQIPHTDHILVLKVREQGNDVETKLGIFDLDGNSLLHLHQGEFWLDVESGVKYEGVEFLGDHEHWDL